MSQSRTTRVAQVVALGAAVVFGAVVGAVWLTPSPASAQAAQGKEAPGRFVLVTAPPIGDTPLVFRMDTATGRTWQFVPAWKAADEKARWNEIPE